MSQEYEKSEAITKMERGEMNKWGCKPSEDVCLEHDEPLWCRHGCGQAKKHKCVEMESPDWTKP